MEPEQNMTGEQKKQHWLLSLLFDNRTSMRRYVLRTGLISLVPSVVIAIILGLFGIINEEMGPDFKGSALSLLIGIVILGPPIETLLMGGLFWVLSFITKRKVRLAMMSAVVWAGLHSIVAPAWGLGVLWPFFVFSCSYLTWRQRAWWRAVLVTSCVHAFQNILPAIAIIAAR